MDIGSAAGLGLALAMDASVVAFSCGLSSREHSWYCPLKLAVTTGFLQGLMPIIGFLAADSLVCDANTWTNRIACGVFLVLGITFIRNAWTGTPQNPCQGCVRCALRHWKNIFAIGIATSIDAFAVGVGMACSTADGNAGESAFQKIIVPALVIAGTTFLCVFASFHATRFFQKLPVKFLGTLAGLILIALAFKSL